MTFPDDNLAKDVIKTVFENALSAESQESLDVVKQTHNCYTCGKATSTVVQLSQTKVQFITNDDRVAELVEKCVEKSGIEELNVIVTQMIAASGDYIDWAKLQTQPLKGADNYSQDDPFANSTAIGTEDVSKMSNHESG
jgi:uncharacterized protein involved in tolerance to divalent cations